MKTKEEILKESYKSLIKYLDWNVDCEKEIKEIISKAIDQTIEETIREVLSIELSADTKTIKTIDDLKTKYEAFGYGQGWIMKKVEELNKLKK